MKKSSKNQKTKQVDLKVETTSKKSKDKRKKSKGISKATRFVFDKRNSLIKRNSKDKQKSLRERLKEQLKASRFRYISKISLSLCTIDFCHYSKCISGILTNSSMYLRVQTLKITSKKIPKSLLHITKVTRNKLLYGRKIQSMKS